MPARGNRTLLTPTQEAIVRDAIARGLTQDEAAWLAGVSRRLLVTRLDDQLADVRIGQGRGKKRRAEVDPTEEEIEAMKVSIRERNGHTPPPDDFTDSLGW